MTYDEKDEMPDVVEENAVRSDLMADLMSEDLLSILGIEMDREVFKRIYRWIAFDLFNRFYTMLPPDIYDALSEYVDHMLIIDLVNRRFGVDLMAEFRREFFDKHPIESIDEEMFDEKLTLFEKEWINTPKEYLGGLTPGEAMEKAYDEWAEEES